MNSRIRIIAALTLVIALIAAVTGCGKKDAGTTFSVVPDLTKLPAGIQTSIALISSAKGFTWFEDETGGYLCVSYGNDSLMIPEVTVMARDKDALRVTLTEKPVPGGAASSISKLTVVRLDGVKNVTAVVSDPKGNALTQLIPSAGAYNGQIDTTSIEISTQGGPVSFQLDTKVLPLFDQTSPQFADLKTKDSVRFCYFRNAQGQNVITYIEKSK